MMPHRFETRAEAVAALARIPDAPEELRRRHFKPSEWREYYGVLAHKAEWNRKGFRVAPDARPFARARIWTAGNHGPVIYDCSLYDASTLIPIRSRGRPPE